MGWNSSPTLPMLTCPVTPLSVLARVASSLSVVASTTITLFILPGTPLKTSTIPHYSGQFTSNFVTSSPPVTGVCSHAAMGMEFPGTLPVKTPEVMRFWAQGWVALSTSSTTATFITFVAPFHVGHAPFGVFIRTCSSSPT